MVSLTTPQGALTAEEQEEIVQLMNFHDEGFFLHVEEKFTAANLDFKIPSEAGRGRVELLQVSVALEGTSINTQMVELLKEILERFARRCKEIPKISAFMYPKMPESAEMRREITNLFDRLYETAESTIKVARQGEVRYQALFKGARDGILLLDYKTSQFIDGNQQAERLAGRTLQEMRGKTPVEVGMHTTEEFHAIRKFIFKQIHDGSLPPFEFWASVPPGRRVPVEISASKIHVGDQDILQLMFRDISDRRESEQKLKDRARYETGIAECFRALFGKKENPVLEALQVLLNTTTASRVSLFLNFMDPADGLCFRQTLEQRNSGIDSLKQTARKQHVKYAGHFSRWQETLQNGHAIKGIVKDFPAIERKVLQPLGIKSTLVLPIVVHHEWTGFIAIDDAATDREWNEDDVRLLETAAGMVGVYLTYVTC